MFKENFNLILVPLAGLVLTLARMILQHYSFSWGFFLGLWLVHCIAIALLSAVSYAAISVFGAKLGDQAAKDLTPDDAIAYFSVFVLVTSLSLLLLSSQTSGA